MINIDEQDKKTAYFPQLLCYISEHYNEKLALTSLASRFYISRTKLARDFASVMKIPVGEFIMLVRIRKAQEKLANGMTHKETAIRCGFASASYFGKQFKKYTKLTPLQFVKKSEKSLDKSCPVFDNTLLNQEILKIIDELKTEENT